MGPTQKLNFCIAAMLALTTTVDAGNEVENAFAALSHAEQLESSLLGESGQQSKLSPMFAVLTQSKDQEEQFQRLATAAATNAGKAYGIVGLYRIRPDKALERASALPANFKIPYTLFCISGEWDHDAFVQQLKEGSLLKAMSALRADAEANRNLVSDTLPEEQKDQNRSLPATAKAQSEHIRELNDADWLKQKVSHQPETTDAAADEGGPSTISKSEAVRIAREELQKRDLPLPDGHVVRVEQSVAFREFGSDQPIFLVAFRRRSPGLSALLYDVHIDRQSGIVQDVIDLRGAVAAGSKKAPR